MDIEKYMIPCMNKDLFGIECLGCGAQRAFLLILNGDFFAAFIMFPAIYTTIILFFFISLLIFDKKQKIFKGKLNYHKIVIKLVVINAVIMLFSYIYKQFLT